MAILLSTSIFEKKATVIVPEIKKTGNYQQPVQEGRCYRQYTTNGRSVLTCG